MFTSLIEPDGRRLSRHHLITVHSLCYSLDWGDVAISDSSCFQTNLRLEGLLGYYVGPDLYPAFILADNNYIKSFGINRGSSSWSTTDRYVSLLYRIDLYDQRLWEYPQALELFQAKNFDLASAVAEVGNRLKDLIPEADLQALVDCRSEPLMEGISFDKPKIDLATYRRLEQYLVKLV